MKTIPRVLFTQSQLNELKELFDLSIDEIHDDTRFMQNTSWDDDAEDLIKSYIKSNFDADDFDFDWKNLKNEMYHYFL